jgi:hypothetical protein
MSRLVGEWFESSGRVNVTVRQTVHLFSLLRIDIWLVRSSVSDGAVMTIGHQPASFHCIKGIVTLRLAPLRGSFRRSVDGVWNVP